MKKILFGITSLTLGGAERVLVDLANELSKKKEYEITILTIYGDGELEKQLSPKVNLKSIYKTKYNELPSLQKKIMVPLRILLTKNDIYKKYIKDRFDIEIAFLEGPITRIISSGKQKEKKIAWIHNDISKVFGTGLKAKIKRIIDEKLYEKFSKLIFVSESNLESFRNTYNNNQAKKEVIYNYIDSKKVLEKAKEPIKTEFDKKNLNFLTVARLVPQKALERLVKIHAKLIKEGMIHNFYIVGEGPEKETLKKLIKSNKCENTLKLLGAKENPYPYMKEADYFCLLSYFEGYPMVIEEAKILNKKILITDTSAKEVITNYNNAKVFENSEDGIYNGLKTIIAENSKKENNQEISEIYDNREIIKKIEQVLEQINNRNE